MSTLTRLLLLVALILSGTSSVFADHMNGRYIGQGNAANLTLELRQSGRQMSGQITGASQATLAGQSDGGDNFTGSMEISGVGQVQFQGQYSGGTVTLRLSAHNGTEDYVFGREGSTPQPQPTPAPPHPTPTPQPPPMPAEPPPVTQSTTQYFLVQEGSQVGPSASRKYYSACRWERLLRAT